jgi:hypothetical protein
LVDAPVFKTEVLSRAAMGSTPIERTTALGERGMARRMEQMKRLREERERLLAQIEALRNQVIGIDRAIAVLDGTEFKAPEERQRDRTRNVKDTVLGLLADAAPNGLSVNQVLEGARNKSIELDRGTVSSLLSRLKRENVLDMKDGQYFVRPRSNGTDHRPRATH